MLKYRNRILAGCGIGFVIYASLLIFVNVEDLVHELQIFPWILLIPVIMLKVVSWFFRFLEWHYFLGVIDARSKISLLDSVALFVSGFAMAVSPGKAAEVLKAVVLKSKTGVSVATSAPMIIAERVVDGLSVIILAFFALLMAGGRIDLGPYQSLIFISAALLALGLIGIQIRPFVTLCLNLIAPLPLIRRIHPWLVSFYESSYEIFKLKHIIPTTGMGMVASLGDVLGFVIILAGFGIEVNGLLFLQALVIVCLSAAIGALSGVPNGAGVTEISVSAMLMLIIAPGNPLMTPAVAATAAFIEGFFHKWFRVLVGLGVAMIFRKRLFGLDVEKAIDELAVEHRQKQSDFSINASGV